MNKLLVLLGLVLVTVSFNSCKSNKNDGSAIVSTGIKYLKLTNQDHKVLDIENIYSSLDLVELKSSNGFIIGNVDKVIVHEDKIYVLDKSIAKRLFLFDLDGNPIHSIGTSDNKLRSISDFSIDGNNLYVLDNRKNEISVFTIIGTRLISKIHLVPNNISNFEVQNGALICYRALVDDQVDEFQNATVFLMNLQGEVKDHWLHIGQKDLYLTRYIGGFPTLQKDKEYVYISRFMDNNFYKYSSLTKKLINSYALDFGKDSISNEMKAMKTDDDFSQELDEAKHSYSISNYIETNRLVKFNISLREFVKCVVIDKKDGLRYDVLKYKGTLLPIIMINQLSNERLIANMPLEVLGGLKKRLLKIKKNDPLAKMLNNFNIKDANPVIIILNK